MSGERSIEQESIVDTNEQLCRRLADLRDNPKLSVQEGQTCTAAIEVIDQALLTIENIKAECVAARGDAKTIWLADRLLAIARQK